MMSAKLNLANEELFNNEDQLSLATSTTLIFGKNGTGKSTLAKLCKEQLTDYDVRVFQGFNSVIGENKKLNAIVLGEENVLIEKQIQQIEKQIEDIDLKIQDLNSEVTPNEEKPNNLYVLYNNTSLNYQKINKELDIFYTQSASKIKNKNNPQLSIPQYNKNNFKSEIKSAILLTEEEYQKNIETLNEKEKIAPRIITPTLNLQDLLFKTNEILKKALTVAISIPEFNDNSNDKREFAEMGFNLHNIGDKCSFCGNIYDENRHNILTQYFAADEMKSFKNEILTLINSIKKIKDDISLLTINSNDFYPNNKSKIDSLNNIFIQQKNIITKFLSTLLESLEEKRKNLDEESTILKIEVPLFTEFEEIIHQYNEIVSNNNKSNLPQLREEAKNKLRYHMISKLLSDFNYEDKSKKLDSTKELLDNQKNQLDQKIKEIESHETTKKSLKESITNLRAQTRNEKKLADKINKELNLYITFKLVYVKNEANNGGYYTVECKRTHNTRDISQISDGEKNIIAFLYFINKLSENTESNSRNKLIIFDDPMNSNDDTMQYIIIENLYSLHYRIQEQHKNQKPADKLIILTHNTHFLINISYNIKIKGENTKYLHLYSINNKTNIKADTIPQTSYHSLWLQLKTLFLAENIESYMLLNLIRRIIETFCHFNCIKLDDFLKVEKGAKKLFNVNSHSIDDLEVDLNGRNKSDIINLLKALFEKNNYINHFETHWHQNDNKEK